MNEEEREKVEVTNCLIFMAIVGADGKCVKCEWQNANYFALHHFLFNYTALCYSWIRYLRET